MKRLLALVAVVVAAPLHAAEPVVGVGIVSSDQKTVFLPAKDGGIEAIDLASGKVEARISVGGSPWGIAVTTR